ncbi:MAG: hypothetical protein ACRCWF_12980 [Beijerinckiaceae bacterium]
MAWSDLDKSRKARTVGFVFVMLSQFLLLSHADAPPFFSDIAKKKAQIIADTRRDLTETCRPRDLPDGMRQECRRLENLLDEARTHQINGAMRLPFWNYVQTKELETISASYSKHHMGVSDAIFSRKTTFHYLTFAFIFIAAIFLIWSRKPTINATPSSQPQRVDG